MILRSILLPSLVAALVATQAVSARPHHQEDCSKPKTEGSPTTYSATNSTASGEGPPTTSGSIHPRYPSAGSSGIPHNVQAFYDKVRAGGSCSKRNDLKS